LQVLEGVGDEMRIRHVILDRDGVLNEEAPRVITDPEQWVWIPGSLEALALLTRAGVHVSVATNQASIGRGLLSRESLAAIHDRMLREAHSAGATINAVFVCPHAPEQACDCRKPAAGLIKQAITVAQIPASQTLLIGDDSRDMEAARAAGVAGALVLTGKGSASARRAAFEPARVYADLKTAVQSLLAEPATRGAA
jgi:D-glycero-D-manno-heptose 1,7-bisphosphate phosphatase